MMDLTILQELVIALAVGVVIVFVSQKIKVPPVIGFLLTGILIGPSGLGIVRDSAEIGALAEVGVVMLLFTVGLEFSRDMLKQIRKTFLLGGAPMQDGIIGLQFSSLSLIAS